MNADPDSDPPPAEEDGWLRPETVHSHEELVALLAEQFARADVSLRELQARADRSGGTRLPRATCADMLSGRRFPRKAVMVAFLRACQVPERRLPAWERAWERVRLARMQPPPAAGAPAQPPPTAPPTAPAVTSAPATVPPTAPAVTSAPPTAPPTVPPTSPPPTAPPVSGRRRRGVPMPAGARAKALAGVLAGALATAAIVTAGAVAWPGSDTLTDDGRAFGPGGSSRFTVSVDPAGGPVRLVRRLDARVSRQRAAITVNGAPAGHWEPLPEGIGGWAEQHVDLPPSVTAGRDTLAVLTSFTSSEWDFGEFRYAVEQQTDGGWHTTDTLDVGRQESEAAHGYRIAGETFRGSRTLEPGLRAAARVRYEAEAGRISHARARSGAAGASQGAVVAGLDHDDSWVDLRVYAPRTGRHTALVTYAAGYGDARHAVTVNGSTRFTLDYPQHGWDVWRQVTASLPLRRGWNTLRFQHHDRWAELDHVEIA